MDDFLLFAGSASRRLGGAIGSYLDQPLAASETHRFSEGNLFVRVLENVRGRDTFLVQGTAFPANDNFMELLFWIDALKRASAASVTAVIPYFSYAKGDKKDEPRVSIRRACVPTRSRPRASTVSSRWISMRRNSKGSSTYRSMTCTRCRSCVTRSQRRRCPTSSSLRPMPASRSVLVSTRNDSMSPTRSRRRNAPTTRSQPHVLDLIGDVEGKTALIVDDFTISAGSLVDAARISADRGAAQIYAMVSHGLITEAAVERLADSPIERLFITDTVETQPVELPANVEVVSVAALFGEAIRRIYRRESISVLFE